MSSRLLGVRFSATSAGVISTSRSSSPTAPKSACASTSRYVLARNYFLVDDHELFPEIQALLAEVEVAPAAVSEMLLRSDDAGVALRGLKEFLEDKKQQAGKA